MNEGAKVLNYMGLDKAVVDDDKLGKEYNDYIFFIKIFSQLTEAEISILRLVNEGKTRKEIAGEKQIELSTVKTHINHILKKLNRNSTLEVINFLNQYKFFEILNEMNICFMNNSTCPAQEIGRAHV